MEATDFIPTEDGAMLGDVNSTWNSQQEWTPEDLTIIVLYCCASLIGTAANVFVIVAVAGSSSRSRNGFILSLCLSDLLVCTLSMPLSVSTILIRFWTTGQAFCKVAFYFQVGSVHLSHYYIHFNK